MASLGVGREEEEEEETEEEGRGGGGLCSRCGLSGIPRRAMSAGSMAVKYSSQQILCYFSDERIMFNVLITIILAAKKLCSNNHGCKIQ